MDTQGIYKSLIVLLLSILMLSNCSSTNEDNKEYPLKYYSPTDSWDEILANFGEELPDYIIFERQDSLTSVKKTDYRFRAGIQKLKINFKGNLGLEVYLENKKVYNNDVKIKASDIESVQVYKIKLDTDSLIVIEFPNLGATGRGANLAYYFAIDSNLKTSILSSYNGRIVCFNDFNGDGKIDFLEVEDTFFYAQIPFEENYTEVYYFNLIELKSGKVSKVSSKFTDLALINCNDSYIQTTKEKVSKMVVNPCE